MFNKTMQKGLTLIEASMVLALSAVVIAGVMFYYQSASDANKVEQVSEEMMSIIGAINGLYSGQSDYDGLDATVIAQTNAVPDKMRDPETKDAKQALFTPYGEAIEITAIDLEQDKNAGYTIKFSVPGSLCMGLATMNFGTNFYSLDIDGDKKSPHKTSLTPQDAATACKNAYSGNVNALKSFTWTLR